MLYLQDEAAACGETQRSGGHEQVGGVEERREGEGQEWEESLLLEEVCQEIHRLGRAVRTIMLTLTICAFDFTFSQITRFIVYVCMYVFTTIFFTLITNVYS